MKPTGFPGSLAAVMALALPLAIASIGACDAPAEPGPEPEPVSALCASGFYYDCPQPACDPAAELLPGESLPTAADDCGAWLDLTECGACQYYACREAEAQCGADGYLLGYGGLYCDRFATVTELKGSPAVAAWLEDVRACLVQSLDQLAPPGTSCDDLWDIGVDSHSDCYLQTGFCDLAVSDWLAVVNSIDPGDVDMMTALVTAQGCLGEWLGFGTVAAAP